MEASRRYRSIALLAGILLLALGCSDNSDSTLGHSGGRVQILLSGASTTVAAASSGATPAFRGAGPSGLSAVPASGNEGDDQGDDHDAGARLQSAEVTFASILARNLDGQLIDVTIALPTTVDVLGLAPEHTVSLPIGFLPPGTYDQFVLVLTDVVLVTLDGTRIQITPPGGGWTVVIPTEPFTVVDGQTTTVHLRFQRDRSFAFLNGQFEFHPSFDCDVDE